MNSPRSFTVNVDSSVVNRIARQVAEYEWPRTPAGASWEQGADPQTMRFLVDRWTNQFDWGKEQAKLNALPHFMGRVGSLDLHFLHFRSSGANRRPAIVLLHGWPSSFLEYIGVAESLAAQSDVVVVSLPGVGFSNAPEKLMGPREMAGLVHGLMADVLGYTRYVTHGSDWGSIISGWLGFDHPQQCAGVHMNMISPRFIAGAATEPEEQKWLAGFRERFEDDGAYFRLQTSRPLTAGYVLADNPVGLLAWMLEKFAAWGDPSEGDKSKVYQSADVADRILRNVMLYLVTRSAATSTWIYRGLANEGPPGYPGGKRVETPVAIAATRDPIFVPPPRSLVEKAYKVARWTDFPRGGHFPGYDIPELLAQDIAKFADSL